MSIVGKTLNQRFYILKSLAQGRVEHTYLAEDRSFQAHHYCIVKHFQPIVARLGVLFDRETDILAKLSLYNNNLIPKLIDKFDQAGELYLVQEFIDGISLAAELIPGRQLPQLATIELLIEILTPLSYCHSEQFIHRQLKPDNIIRRDRTRQLVLIDFGIANLAATNTTDKFYRGTPGYAPEEQQYGEPVAASDIYAVGKIAIQALTGIHPTELRRNPQTMEWEWRKYCHVTDDFAAVLDRMVELLAARRYQNASEALAAVQSLLVDKNFLGSPPSPHSEPIQLGIAAPPVKQTFRFETAKLERGIFELESPTIVKSLGIAEYITEDLGNGVKLEMVYIPAGTFMMGSQQQNSEQPIHQVNLGSFYIGKYTITQEQYQAIVGKNPSTFKGSNHPVECVSWNDAMEFCERLSQRTDQKYTLPSESQWEYACRGGSNTPFYFGETITPDLVNHKNDYSYRKVFKGMNRERTTAVGNFPPNTFGLYDMHGNVWEWCLDTWHQNYQGAPTDGSGWIETTNNNYHLLRGGSWGSNPDYCRSAYRVKRSAMIRYYSIGFRVCLAGD
jgi:eukaryotic-like serine/threonine-protein kinase